VSQYATKPRVPRDCLDVLLLLLLLFIRYDTDKVKQTQQAQIDGQAGHQMTITVAPKYKNKTKTRNVDDGIANLRSSVLV